MGYVLFWAEGMAVALLCLALVAAWAAARGSFLRMAGVIGVFLTFAGMAAFAAHATAPWQREWGKLLPADLFVYSLSWLLVYLVGGTLLLGRAFRRPAAGMARTAAGWPRGKLGLGLGGAVLALGLTFWNLDLAARADLAVARQEAGEVLLTLSPPPGSDSDQAARLFVEAGKDLVPPGNPWRTAVEPGRPTIAWQVELTWTDPHVVDLVARQEKALALVRRAAALPPGSLAPRSLDLSAWQEDGSLWAVRRNERVLLAVDARVKAAQGNLGRALEDVAALVEMSRHASGMMAAPETLGTQAQAWRTLEDALRLAPAGKPVPDVPLPEGVSPLRTLHREIAMFGMIWPALVADDPLRIPEIRQGVGVWSEPPLASVVETVVTPGCRIFLTPAELAYSRRKWDAYRLVLREPPEGTPRDWADVRTLIDAGPMGLFSAVFVRPKEQVLLRDAENLAALEQLARAGLAAARYRAKHGRYPEHLEQLVPEFLPAMPTDPRDGQALRLRHFAEVTVLYTLKNNPELADATGWNAGKYRDQTVFRLVH